MSDKDKKTKPKQKTGNSNKDKDSPMIKYGTNPADVDKNKSK